MSTHAPNILTDETGRPVFACGYQAVAAGPTKKVLGATGAAGDYLAGLLVIPATTSPGNVLIRDSDAGSDVTLFAGGASSVADLKPFWAPFGAKAASGAWEVTTGSNVSVVAVGNFT